MKFLAPIISCLVLAGLIIGCQSDTASMSEEVKKARIEEMYAGYNDEFPDIEAVTPAEIADAYKKNEIIIVDVREPNEQAISMIPGALTKIEFEEKRAAGTLEDKPIYMHCTIGYRSGKYTQSLNEQGVKAKNIKGSLLLWTHEGLPLETPDGTPTKTVNVYGEKWNLLADGYEGVTND
jgi:rhodanese-related sulfurtransferase